MASENPEQLLDAFKAAALSVTKLYKTSAAAQGKARADGYQDCLDDLLAFLDKENIGLSDGEGWRIRRWATERLDGRDSSNQTAESEDEAEKAEAASSPEMHRAGSAAPQQPTTTARGDAHMRTDSAPPSLRAAVSEEPVEIVVPTQETFSFRSAHPYPQESCLNIANLDLSDSRPQDLAATLSAGPTPPLSTSRAARQRHGNSRIGSKSTLGRGAGAKRKLNLAEFFEVGGLGHGKDMFGGNGGSGGPGGGNSKRNRHV